MSRFQGKKSDSTLGRVPMFNNIPMEVVYTYQYLGINLKPSRSMQVVVGELFDKANRAWFAISNVLDKYKRW